MKRTFLTTLLFLASCILRPNPIITSVQGEIHRPTTQPNGRLIGILRTYGEPEALVRYRVVDGAFQLENTWRLPGGQPILRVDATDRDNEVWVQYGWSSNLTQVARYRLPSGSSELERTARLSDAIIDSMAIYDIAAGRNGRLYVVGMHVSGSGSNREYRRVVATCTVVSSECTSLHVQAKRSDLDIPIGYPAHVDADLETGDVYVVDTWGESGDELLIYREGLQRTGAPITTIETGVDDISAVSGFAVVGTQNALELFQRPGDVENPASNLALERRSSYTMAGSSIYVAAGQRTSELCGYLYAARVDRNITTTKLSRHAVGTDCR